MILINFVKLVILSLLFICKNTKKYQFVLMQNQQNKSMSLVTEFNDYRGKMNEKIMASDNKVIKRIFNLDTNTYAEGALSEKTKEMMGLACSMVLRCDDCVKYHLGKCYELGVKSEEIQEIFSVATLIGGTIVVPHLRRATEYWEALINE